MQDRQGGAAGAEVVDPLLKPCLRPGAPADCLGQPLLEFVGPIPLVGGSQKDRGRNQVVDLEDLSRDPEWQVRVV